MTTLANFLYAVALPPAWAAVFAVAARLLRARYGFYSSWIGGAACGGVIIAVLGDWWPWATGAVVSILIALFLWWFNRRRRDKAHAWAGQKWRHLLAAMVRTMHERSRPRPVLAPRGAGA